jgi:tRNA threonylcarbamoyladenosine biosynthesis protein TsaB
MDAIVIIDTTSNQEITVGIDIAGKKYVLKQPLTQQKAQVVLPLIEKLLTQHHLTLENVKAIQVNPGPGSFTGVRVGLTIANTLGALLKIPVNQNSVGKPVGPIYDKIKHEFNI